MKTITGNEIQEMVRHWLKVSTHGYLGSNYGQDIKALLQQPLSSGAADSFLRKMREDIPALAVFPSGSVNLYSVTTPPDKVTLIIDIAGIEIEVPEV